MDDHFEQVALGFSHKALVYDAFGQDHPNLARMRGRVYRHTLRYLRPGDRILELNAGTGGDAAFYAGQGFAVHATDLAPGMMAAIAEKAARPALEGRLTYQQISFTCLEQVSGGPYSYILSNFGGLNCIADLREVTRALPDILSPGGRLTWVIMPPVAPWELALLFKGQPRLAFRRLRSGGVRANVEGAAFQVHYFTPRQVLSSLGPDFRLIGLEGLAIFTPPADRKDFAFHHPHLYAALARLDERIAHLPPFHSLGDFFILTAEFLPR
ncbi:MAG TPA: class I SAM-dependent methyltransferase [Anaerolineaceae bacterium]|jgi:SAM-dependent methyltransferase